MDSNMQTDITTDISPDGGVMRSGPMTDVDRALSTGKNKSNNAASIEDLEIVDESKDNAAIDTDPSKGDIDFNSFLKEAGKEITKNETNKDKSTDEEKETTDKVEEDKSEEKKDATVEHDDKQLSQSNKKPNVDKTVNRDYSDIDDDHKDLFKRMHNDAYNLLKPVYKEHKVLKVENEKLKKDYEDTSKAYKTLKDNGPQLPDSYFENPQGFLLDPEFHQAAHTVNDAQMILNHWDKQYRDVAAGAKEFDYLDRDKNTGQLIISRKVKAEAGIEAELLKYVNHAQQYVNNSQAKIQAIQMSHGTKSSEAVKALKTNIQKEYGVFDLPDNKPIYEPLIKSEMEQLSPVFRNSPLAEGYVKARVMVFALSKLLQQASQGKGHSNDNNKGNTNGNGNKNNNVTNKNPRNKQPSQEEINGAVGNTTKKGNEGDNVTFDDFKAAKGTEM
jgi:hypothetical protein